MSQNLQNFVKFQKFQLDNLVDFEKCCKTHIYLQKSEPIQPKTSNILPKFCQPTLGEGQRDHRVPPEARPVDRGGVLHEVRPRGRDSSACGGGSEFSKYVPVWQGSFGRLNV